MKSRIAVLICVLAFATGMFAMQAAGGSSAQPSTPPTTGQGQGQGQGPGRMPTAEDQVRMLDEKLNLTDKQKTDVKQLIEETHAQMLTIRSDESLSRENKMDRARKLHEASMSKLRDMLTDDQKKKFDDMQQQMKDHHGEKPQGGDTAPK